MRVSADACFPQEGPILWLDHASTWIAGDPVSYRVEGSIRGAYAITPPEAESPVRLTSTMVTSSSFCVGSTKDLRLDIVCPEPSAKASRKRFAGSSA